MAMIEMYKLNVLIAGQIAGCVQQYPDGSLAFSYKDDYVGVPLSLSMPAINRTFPDKVIRPYLFGLLPDSYAIRKNLGREYGVSANNPIALLSHIGLDCPGAVQFCSDEELDDLPRNGSLDSISDEEIAHRLNIGRTNLDAKWETDHEHWSLGGQQSKFALRLRNGRWYSCAGSQATTHIFKPGISHLKHEALNEFVCLKAARQCGVPSSTVEYLSFNEEYAIVVKRYDRVQDDEDNVLRLHQEDFCQALGIFPDNKYSSEGGPSANDVISVLKQTGGAASRNISSFMDMLFINYLLGAPDAHAKNYSVLLDRYDSYLAPLYDLASMLPYTDRPLDIKLAMGIASENRIGHLSVKRLEKFVEMNKLCDYGVTGLLLAERLASLAAVLPSKLVKVLNDNSDLPGIGELGERLLSKVEDICSLSIARLN